MSSMMIKTTLREIRQSLGRYLAIMAIVALGVGFFAGLKSTQPAMLKTAERYWDEKQLYDFRLLCTLGFGEEETELVAAREDVRAAQGAYSFDILCQGADDSAFVVKAHSITENINGLEVKAGRLPQTDGECVVDSRLFSKKYIGKKLKLSESNEEADLEHFTYTEYKIVGIVDSSYYSQFERGNTSLGSGTISGFVYLLPEGFDADAYTEMFVKLDQDFPLYSEEYDAYIEEKEPEWELFLDELGEIRYANVLAQAEEKLADAEKELEEGRLEGEVKLADAGAELEKAGKEIEDGRKQLEDGRKELEKGFGELQKAEQELDKAAREIAGNSQLLAEKESELAAGENAWKANKEALEKSRETLEENAASMETNEAELLAGESTLAQKEAELLEGEEQLAAMEALLNAGLGEIDKKEQELDIREQELLDKFGFVPEHEQEVIDAERQALASAKEPLLAGKEEMDANRAALEDGKRQIEEAKKQLADARGQLEAGKVQLADGRNRIKEGDQQLNSAWDTIKDGKEQLREGKTGLVKARLEIEKGRLELADAKAQLEEAQKELEEKETEFLEGEKEYLDGLKEYEEGVAEFEEELADAQRQLADANEELRKIEKPEQYLLGRDTNVGYLLFESDSSIVDKISDVFPVFFFLVAALVCMTTMSRMIEEQRTQIGVLKALGYSRHVIMMKYIFYSGSAALIGCIGGFLIGVLVFPYVIWVCYGMMYDMGNFTFVFDGQMALLSLFVSLLCSVGTTWYSCHRELNEVAAQLMRPRTPQAGKRIFLEYIPFIWKRLKFLQKVSVRNVLRYKKRFFMMVLGISGCTALVLAAFGINDSVAEVVTMQYDEITVYDMSMVLHKPFDGEVAKKLESTMGDEVSEYSFIMESTVELQLEEGIKSVYLVVPGEPDELDRYVDMHTLSGESVAPMKKGEAVITHKLAQDYGYQVGDSIELTDAEHRTISVNISGIMQNFVYNYVYIHPDTYMEQIGRVPEYKTIYANLSETEVDSHALSASLMKLDSVTAVTVNADVKERLANMMSSIDYIIILVILCAAALAFIVIYNLTNINITERIREIATIKVLGFYKNETANYVFRENIILTIAGSFAGLVLGKLLHLFIMQVLNIDMVAFDNRITAKSYLFSVLLTFLFSMCVNRMMVGKLEKISMTESLKSVD